MSTILAVAVVMSEQSTMLAEAGVVSEHYCSSSCGDAGKQVTEYFCVSQPETKRERERESERVIAMR